MSYLYGDEINYKYDLIKPEDLTKLQAFCCGNKKLDHYIHKELIINREVDVEDGLPFKVYDIETNEILGIFSLASSGIIYKISNYTHVLPAIKIDVFAIDEKYQKLHMDLNSQLESDPNNHFYFSDIVMCDVIKHCRNISENMALAKYIVLYADKKAKRFYERNLFNNFSEFMKRENNMEICKNDPMYLVLD